MMYVADKTKRQKIIVILILIIGLFLRIHSTDFTREIAENSDSACYSYAAKNLITIGMLTNDRTGQMNRGEIEAVPTSTLMPGMPIFLAGLYLINDSASFVYMVQILLSLVTLCLIYKMMRLFGVQYQIAVFVLLLAAVYPAFCYNHDFILTETLFMALLTAALYLFVSFLKHANMVQNMYKHLVFSVILLMCATMVRAQALPFIAVEIFFVLIYLCDCPLYKRMQYCGVILGIALVFLLPLWIRNWVVFHEFWLLTQSGAGPQIWGAQPYFLDMSSTVNVDYAELIAKNRAISPETYWKWRLFGMFNFMWYDFWDENLVHPFEVLRLFRLIHPMIVIPTIAAIPLIIRKARKEILLIAAVPLLFTMMYLPFHGISRYVFPSIPCVFVLLGIMLDWAKKILKKQSTEPFAVIEQQNNNLLWFKRTDCIFRYVYLCGAAIFTVVLLYSVSVFGWNIKTEMSEYRVQRTYNVSVQDVDSYEVLQSVKLINDQSLWNVANVLPLDANTFQGQWDATPILNIAVPAIEGYQGGKDIVTKVELNLPGGYLYDGCTVYWTGERTPEISEDCVYGKFPRNAFQGAQTVYIDDNVESLMVVPCTFRGSKFSVENIKITKYLVPESK